MTPNKIISSDRAREVSRIHDLDHAQKEATHHSSFHTSHASYDDGNHGQQSSFMPTKGLSCPKAMKTKTPPAPRQN